MCLPVGFGTILISDDSLAVPNPKSSRNIRMDIVVIGGALENLCPLFMPLAL